MYTHKDMPLLIDYEAIKFKISAAAIKPLFAVTITVEPYPEHASPPVAFPDLGSRE